LPKFIPLINGGGQTLVAPVFLATQKAEIRRIIVQSQPRQIVHKTLSQKKLITKKKDWQSGSKLSTLSSNPCTTQKKKRWWGQLFQLQIPEAP
jgi:hypothetical protein